MEHTIVEEARERLPAERSHHLGIDLHQKFSYWTLMNNERKILYQGKVITSEKTTRHALRSLPVDLRSIQAAIEPVSQWGWYADMLEREGVKVKLADAYKAKLIGSSKLKNDKVDSVALAELLRTDFLPEAYLAPRATRELRELVRWRLFFVRSRTQIKNRIHAMLWKHGLSSPRTDLFGLKGRAWLDVQPLRPVFERERVSLLRTLDAHQKEITAIGLDIRGHAKLDGEAKLLMSMPGVGPITALTIQAEVGDFSRFARPEKLAAYAGLVSRSRSSGGTERLGSITRQGSTHLRTAMVEAACRISEKHGSLHAFYVRLKEKNGKGSGQARVALARKMLTILWHMVHNTRTFQRDFGYSGSVKR